MGHDLRWHAWSCSVCSKRGGGLRFSCAECPENNICNACMKAACKPTTPPVAEPTPSSGSDKVISPVVPPLLLPQTPANTRPVKSEVTEQIGSAENQAGPSKPQRVSRDSSARKPRDRSAGASVLSMQSTSTSSAAHLLGAMATRQQGGRSADRPRRPKPIAENGSAIGEASEVGAPSEIAATAVEPRKKSQAAPSTQPQRRSSRAGGSVLSVKNASSSSAAGLLGPLLEQKAKR